MADVTWVADTHALAAATLAEATEFRVVDDPAGTPVSKKTTIAGIRARLVALANIWAATQTITQANNTSALIITGSTLTGSNAQSLVDLSQTWNTSGTPTALKINITDTASGPGSRLIEIQRNNVGRISFECTANESLIKFFSQGGNEQLRITGNNGVNTSVISTSAGGGLLVSALSSLLFAGGTAIREDGANILAQRNDTNAQTHRCYRTFTDASNFERAAIQTGVGYIELAAETAGTGTDDLDVRLTPAGAGLVRFGTHGAIGVQVTTGYIEIKDAGGTTRRLAVVS